MGHKGVSKRKPKKSKSFSNDNINGSSNTRPGESMPEHPLVKDNGATLNRGGTNPATGSNKENRKGN